MLNFSEFSLHPELNRTIANLNFVTPTDIQAQAIPAALQGNDILATSQTGTGKTAAFAIPLISHLLNSSENSSLVIAPTREIALQTMNVIRSLLPSNSGIKTALLIGGKPIAEQLDQMRWSPRIIIGTPGRINDHIARDKKKFANVNFVVLDEVDRMLDMGFEIQINTILPSLYQKRQTLMFSATLPDNIHTLAKKYLNNPLRIAMNSINLPKAQIIQETIKVNDSDKYDQLLSQIQQREGSIIVFMKTKFDVDRMASKLRLNQHTADAMHGDLRQRQRDKAIKFFRSRKNRIMVATDIAARGLDIPHIEHVINYDLPHCPEDYVHRIGRTARAGANGSALNLVSPQDDKKWKAICKLMGIQYDEPSVDKANKPKNFKMRNRKGASFQERGNETKRSKPFKARDKTKYEENSNDVKRFKPVREKVPGRYRSEENSSDMKRFKPAGEKVSGRYKSEENSNDVKRFKPARERVPGRYRSEENSNDAKRFKPARERVPGRYRSEENSNDAKRFKPAGEKVPGRYRSEENSNDAKRFKSAGEKVPGRYRSEENSSDMKRFKPSREKFSGGYKSEERSTNKYKAYSGDRDKFKSPDNKSRNPSRGTNTARVQQKRSTGSKKMFSKG